MFLKIAIPDPGEDIGTRILYKPTQKGLDVFRTSAAGRGPCSDEKSAKKCSREFSFWPEALIYQSFNKKIYSIILFTIAIQDEFVIQLWSSLLWSVLKQFFINVVFLLCLLSWL